LPIAYFQLPIELANLLQLAIGNRQSQFPRPIKFISLRILTNRPQSNISYYPD